MNIRFLGAVRGVTGSCHLIQFKDQKILLDCGMYQGKDEDLNLSEFEVNPSEIDCVLLSHSHIDHSGRIPLLVKKGFKGSVLCTKSTYDLCKIMLLDSAHIQTSEATWKNEKAKRSGKPLIEPMYTERDASDSLRYFKPFLYGEIINICEGLTIRFNDAGHILGSSIIEMWFEEDGETIKLVFTGDLGMKGRSLLRDPAIIESADYLIMESTYGNRVHEKLEHRTRDLIEVMLKTTDRGGTVIIPSFAVGRTQEIIYELNKYYDCYVGCDGVKIDKLRKIPVYIDSPLASEATQIFKQNAGDFDEEAKKYIMSGDNPLEFKNLHFTKSVEESKRLNMSNEPKIIISSSGMCEAGRIKHHLKHNIWKKESTIIFVGYQAEGTLGRRILEGEKDLKILGENIRVKAEIYNAEGFSAHADKINMLEWLQGFKEKPKKVFLVHGEPDSKKEFAEEIEKQLGMSCIIPEYNTAYEIKSSTAMEEVDLGDELITGRRETANKEEVEILLKNLQDLKVMFENAFSKTEGYLKDQLVNKEAYKKINNNILELENELINLKMLGNGH